MRHAFPTRICNPQRATVPLHAAGILSLRLLVSVIVGTLLLLPQPDVARLGGSDGRFRLTLRFNAVRHPEYQRPLLDKFRLRLLRRAGLSLVTRRTPSFPR